MEEIFDVNKENDKNLTLVKVENQIFWYIELGNKDLNTKDYLRNCAFYAYYNYGILDEICKRFFGFGGEEYLEFIKTMCEKFKSLDHPIGKSKDYLYFEKIIEENLGEILDYEFKRDLRLNSIN